MKVAIENLPDVYKKGVGKIKNQKLPKSSKLMTHVKHSVRLWTST